AFGGTAPYVQTWAASGSFNFFPIYAMALLIISALAVFTVPETKGKDLTVMSSH
ncbi:MFS transporter, partial [Leucobacter sp. M11]|nr:MFS transporter [Leucobacter sp. M11]